MNEQEQMRLAVENELCLYALLWKETWQCNITGDKQEAASQEDNDPTHVRACADTHRHTEMHV